MDKKRLIRAVAAAFTAQFITVAVSALTVFLLAGSLDAAGYGLWQLFALAGSYSGIFHLGLCDGVYLRLGGLKYGELNYGQLGRQFRRMLLPEATAALIIAVPVMFFCGGSGRMAALSLALLYMPIFNAAAYLGYVLQATGRTAEYSMSTVIDRMAFVALAAGAALSGAAGFVPYIAASISAKLISLGYCVYKNRRLVFFGRYISREIAGARAAPGVATESRAAAESWEAPAPQAAPVSQTAADIAAGSKLLWANLSGQLISGAARIAIILRWGDAEFGRISFVMTLSALFLQFAAQLGMVVFPSLRREEREARGRIVARMRSAAELALPAVFLMYLPAKLAVGAWLPQYSPKLSYLALILPLCLFEGRTQLVNQTYLKVSRMEGRLLGVNLRSAGLSVILCFFSAFALNSAPAVLVGAVISSAARCYMSDALIPEGERRHALMSLLSDAAVSAVFVISATMLPDISAAMVYALFYMVYLFIRRAELPCLGLKKA